MEVFVLNYRTEEFILSLRSSDILLYWGIDPRTLRRQIWIMGLVLFHLL